MGVQSSSPVDLHSGQSLSALLATDESQRLQVSPATHWHQTKKSVSAGQPTSSHATSVVPLTWMLSTLHDSSASGRIATSVGLLPAGSATFELRLFRNRSQFVNRQLRALRTAELATRSRPTGKILAKQRQLPLSLLIFIQTLCHSHCLTLEPETVKSSFGFPPIR